MKCILFSGKLQNDFYCRTTTVLAKGIICIISSTASGRKSSWNMGYSVKLLCGTQLLQLVNYAHGPSLEVKDKCEKRNTKQICQRNQNVH